MPLLPRAPIRAARARAAQRSAQGRPAVAPAASSTATAVMSMFVPVSPSATGNTLRSSISPARASSAARAAATTRTKRSPEAVAELIAPDPSCCAPKRVSCRSGLSPDTPTPSSRRAPGRSRRARASSGAAVVQIASASSTAAPTVWLRVIVRKSA